MDLSSKRLKPESATQRFREKLSAAVVLELFGQHERWVQSLVEFLEGHQIEGFESLLVIFERPVDAVQSALDHRQQLMELGGENGVTLTVRARIHLEVLVISEASQLSRHALDG